MTPQAPNKEPVVHARLLALLLERPGPWSIEALAGACDTSTEAVQHHLDELQRAGCSMEREPASTVALYEAGLSVWLDYLQHRFGPRRPMHVYRRTASTQDVCRRIALNQRSPVSGTIVVANEQTAGRGRLGRSWQAPGGKALTFSVTHLPQEADPTAAIERLTLATSVALSV